MSKLLEHLKGKELGFWVLLISLVFFFMALIIYCVVTGKSAREVTDIKDVLQNILLLLVGYRWGSSRGSRDKQEQLDRLKSEP